MNASIARCSNGGTDRDKTNHGADAAERTLQACLNAQYEAMLRRRIPPEVVERELRSLELAIRIEVQNIRMRGDAA